MKKENKNYQKRNCTFIRIQEFLLNLDRYGEPVSTFTLKGSTVVKSWPTCLMTVVFLISILTYGIIRFKALLNHEQFTVVKQDLVRYFEPDYNLNINQTNFKMAFAVVGWDKQHNMQIKSDPNYVRWQVRLNTFSPIEG